MDTFQRANPPEPFQSSVDKPVGEKMKVSAPPAGLGTIEDITETPEIQKNTARIGVPILPYSVREIANQACARTPDFHPDDRVGDGERKIGGLEQLAIEMNPNRFDPFEALDEIRRKVDDFYRDDRIFAGSDEHLARVIHESWCESIQCQVDALRAYITGRER